MQLALGLTSGMELQKIHDLTTVAEKANIRKLWLGDDILGPHDVFTVASSILLKHRNTSVGIGITSPLVRNITTIARASAALVQIGGGDRFRLGLGVGGLQDLRKLGINIRNPANILKSASTLLHEIWSGKKVTFETGPFKLSNYHSSVTIRHQIPIFFGVRGPRLLNLAGEMADGVLLSGPVTYLRKAIGIVKESLERNGRSEEGFSFIIWIPTMLIQQKSDTSLIKQVVAYVLSDTPKNVLELAELDLAKVANVQTTLQRDGVASAAELVDESLLNETAVQGSAQQICKSLKSFERMGVQEIVFGPPYGAQPLTAFEQVANAWRDQA